MKKKSNKLEVTVLVILIMGLVTFGIYRFLYIPKTETIAELEQELELLNIEKAVIDEKIASIPKLENDITKAEIVVYSGAPMFFYNIVQENLILLLDAFSDRAPMKVSSYGFSEASASNIATVNPSIKNLQYELKQLVDNYVIKYGSGEQRQALLDRIADTVTDGMPSDVGDASQIAKTSVSISFQSTYNELISYLKLLEDYERKIVVNNLSISGQDENNVSGSMSVDFYELPKLFPNEADFIYSDWAQELPKGKSSPFGNSSSADSSGANNSTNTNSLDNNADIGNIGNGDITVEDNTNGTDTVSDINVADGDNSDNTGNTGDASVSTPKESKEPDFFIIARSYYSDLPTMTIGVSSDEKGDTFVRDTSDREQTVTIELTEQDGKYYYSYKTDRISYPRSGINEFTPSGSSAVNIVIYSSRRSSDRDVNMLNIVIDNKTELEANTIINGDDRTRPRINLTKK